MLNVLKNIVIFSFCAFSFVAEAKISELTEKAMSVPSDANIYFYYHTMPYYEFTNFWADDPILIDGKVWPTTEHYYQAQKFIGEHEGLQEKIRTMKTPGEVFKLAHTRTGTERAKIRKDWDQILVDVMRKAVRAKFEQHPELMNVLKSTGKRLLVEHTKNDSFWGDGNKDRSGHTEVTLLNNWLGKVLMEIRDGTAYVYNPNDY